MSEKPDAERWTLLDFRTAACADDLADEIRVGLSSSPKQLPCRYFYDAEGSKIFEEICQLPEYYLTRVERDLLERYTSEILAFVPPASGLVELGSGSAEKTRLLIEALLARDGALTFAPIDISLSALEASASDLLARFPDLDVCGLAGEYERGLEQLHRLRQGDDLILWLGSSAGNFSRTDAAAFLSRLRGEMLPGDQLLLGVDLRKDAATLERAYHDSQGVTARFNLNLLTRINRELGGEFDLSGFDFEAIYRERQGVVQSYLVSRRKQRVRIEALDLEVDFEAGERIHTEDSYKYSSEEIEGLATQSGLRHVTRWIDDEARFCLALLAPERGRC